MTTAEVGPEDAPTLVLHGHLDVVPGRADQFEPRLEGDRLFGRGAYDMKGALAVMMLVLHELREQDRCGCGSGSSPTRSPRRRRTAAATLSSTAASSATSRSPASPPTSRSGSQAKGVLAMRLEVSGRAAHGATPWLGRQRGRQGG